MRSAAPTQMSRFVRSPGLVAGSFVDSLDHPCRLARGDHPGRDVFHDHGACGDDAPLPHPAPLEDHGVRADEHPILDDDGARARRLKDPGEDGARADVAIPTDQRPCADDRVHVDHRTRPDRRADVDHRAHHDDDAIADLDPFANDRARLDPGVHPLEVEERDGGVAPVVLHVMVEDPCRLTVQDLGHALPLPDEDRRPRPRREDEEVVARRDAEIAVVPDPGPHRRPLPRVRDDVADPLVVHDSLRRVSLP